MTFRRSLLVFSLVAALVPNSLHASESEWPGLWLGTEKPTKGDTHLPDGLTASMFDLSEDNQAVVEIGGPSDNGDSVSDLVRDVAMEDDGDQTGGNDSASDSEMQISGSNAQPAGAYPPPNFVIRDKDSRSPASVKTKKNTKLNKASKKQTNKTAAKSGLQKVTLTKSNKPMPAALNTTAMASEAQARWPAGASEGFEFRVRHKAQLSSMWVMKRQDRYDVVYATNGGSRVNLTIPPDQFYALTTAASELRSTASTTEKCRDSFVQVHVVSSGSGRAVASCLEAKGKDADKLRMLGAALSNFVR